MLLDFTFLLSAFIKTLHLFFNKKPFDFVITVAPSFHFGLLGVLSKRLWKSKFVYHIQDMQIEAARDLNIIKYNKVIDYLFKIERYIFDNADIVSSISSSMVHKIQNKANKEVIFFPNWADIKSFHPIEDKLKLKSEFGFSKADIIILYSGAIGEKQGLESIVYLAKEFILQSQLKFIICGSGPYKQQLLDLAASMNIHNIRFFPIQPIEKFNRFLNMADVHLVIQKSHAGDLVMPSKLVTILAIGGLALITADEASGLYSLIKEHNMGLLVKADNQQALFSGIQKAISEDNCVITKNARTYAENHLSIDSVMETFINDVSL